MGVVLACHEAYVGGCSRWGFPRRVVGRLCCRGRSSSLRVLERRAKKLGSQSGGKWFEFEYSVRPVPSCEWRTFTRHRLGLRPIVQVNCYACAHTIECGSQSTNTNCRPSHCHTTPL